MSEKEKQVFIQKIIRIVVATVSLIVFIISLWILLDCFKKPVQRNELVVNYNSNTSLDYKVYLKPNKFYEKNFLEKNKKYLSSIVDYVDVNLSYLFNATKKLNTSYNYSINAKISSDYDSNGVTAELWSKNYTLIPAKSSTIESSTFKITENLKIDYEKYDNLAKNFKEEYGVVADTKLTITININSTSKLQGYDSNLTDKKTVTLVMPLNKAVTDVTISGTEPTTNNITKTITPENNVNYVLLTISVVLLLVSLPTGFISFYKLFKITNVSQYIVQQKRILKNYGDIIAEVTTKPDLREIKVIRVKEFEDLINIEEELRVPILFYELRDRDESWFVINTVGQAYLYVLKSTSHM